MTDTRNLTAGSFPPGPWLEIVRGRTSFPCRPVRGDRFLIGAGSHCDLQLGGDDIPMLHSVIVVDHRGTTIEAFTATPELLVNGAPSRSIPLSHHDSIQIGRIQLRFHNPAAVVPTEDSDRPGEEPPEATALPSQEDLELADTPAGETAELTVEQLIDRLEEEQSAIDSLEQRRLAGAQALLDAIRRAGAQETLDQATDEPGAGTDAAEIESIPIRPVVDEWDERERQLLEMEQTLAAKAASLATVQDRLAEQIGQIREHVRQLESPEEPETLRISA